MNHDVMISTEPRFLAEQAAQAIRWLNHRTLVGAGYEYPSDADDTIAQLEVMAQRLPQALEQLAYYVRDLARREWAGMDDGSNPAGCLLALSGSLSEAIRTANLLGAFLGEAHNLSARLTYTGPDLSLDPADRSDLAGGYL